MSSAVILGHVHVETWRLLLTTVSAHLLLWMSRWRWREKGVRNRALHSSHWKGLSSEWVCRKSRACLSCVSRAASPGTAMTTTGGDRASSVGWLAVGKPAQRGLKFKVLLFFFCPPPHARPVRLSDTSIPRVNTGDLRGGPQATDPTDPNHLRGWLITHPSHLQETDKSWTTNHTL